MEKQIAAAELGMAETEVLDIYDTDLGPVAVLQDNTKMVKTEDGWIFLVAPSDNYLGTYPVLGGPDAEAIAAEVDAGPAPGSPEALADHDPSNDSPVDPGAMSLVTDPGPQPLADSGANEETGAHNLSGGADDPGTVVPVHGTADEILDWAGDDPARIDQAISAEQGKDKPRTSLLAKLEAKRS